MFKFLWIVDGLNYVLNGNKRIADQAKKKIYFLFSISELKKKIFVKKKEVK